MLASFWRERLLLVLGAKPGIENMRLLNAWHLAEGGTAKNNPLNTSYKLSNSTVYNSAGVQNYVRPVEGICATALTLVNGFYNGILGDLQSGSKTAEMIVRDRSVQFQKWGTSTALMLTILKETP